MILYLDTSALAKLYLAEAESLAVKKLVQEAEMTATSVITRVELSAAIAKAVRMKLISRSAAQKVLDVFHRDWPDFGALQITEAVLSSADRFAWQMGLRGYDAMHLAAAHVWQQSLSEPVTVATFDHQLWSAVRDTSMIAWPPELLVIVRT